MNRWIVYAPNAVGVRPHTYGPFDTMLIADGFVAQMSSSYDVSAWEVVPITEIFWDEAGGHLPTIPEHRGEVE